MAQSSTLDPVLRSLMYFHTLDTTDCIKDNDVLPLFPHINPDPVMPADDEFVEDAGLFDHDNTQEETDGKNSSKRRSA